MSNRNPLDFARSTGRESWHDPSRLSTGVTRNFSLQPRGVAHAFSSPPGMLRDSEPPYNEVLARSIWLERYGGMISVGLLVLSVLLAGILFITGQRAALTVLTYVAPALGGILALLFCSSMLWIKAGLIRKLQRIIAETTSSGEATLQSELQALRSACLIWLLLTLGVLAACFTQGLWIWFKIAVHQPLAAFSDLNPLPAACMYPCFFIGLLLLARIHATLPGRFRLILDALMILGATLALSWFFLLAPLLASMHSDLLTQGLAVYLPASDIILVSLAAFFLCCTTLSPELDPVFGAIFWGLCLLAVSDSLLQYEALNRTLGLELIRALLDPCALLLIASAAIKYPQSVVNEHVRLARQPLPLPMMPQLSLSLRTLTPFLLALIVCALLSTVVAAHGSHLLLQSTSCAGALIAVFMMRQIIILFENARAARQLLDALLVTQRELGASRTEIVAVTCEMQEKRTLEEALESLRTAHTLLARGDFSARASVPPGPLVPMALSFNLMVERLGLLKQQTEAYERLRAECDLLRTTVEQFANGALLVPLPRNNQRTPELSPIFLSLLYFQRQQQQQWQAQMQTLASIETQMHHLYQQCTEIENSTIAANTDRLTYGRLKGSMSHLRHQIEQLKQRIGYLHTQFSARDLRSARPERHTPVPEK
ncbi:methyl-accepting chemotaxis protein [Dictyobacter arantiisoli]|uniref:HAMP domain-containing protein n=1 Tax=Dictyobacter arantiisoli TaxID=2014874 RepID=A0A5A5TEH7_9CHLR|nr:methyl-accepting chemotaxis protein [Dictyobacter arantiisoli]GCF09635.1 hypothetical protein KDI_31990 [Dictyobacter arantiisoli]